MNVHDIDKKRNSFIAKHNRRPDVVFMSDVDFQVLYEEYKRFIPINLKALTEKTKVAELLGMEIYVSPELEEGEVYIGYVP